MKIIKLWRTFKEGLKNFYRNGWLSFATVSVMSVSLYIMAITILMVIGSNLAIRALQDKVNVSIYFNPNVTEDRILEIKRNLANYSEIEKIEYVSKDQALDDLKALTKNDPFIEKALKEIGSNPLFSSLVIKARQPEQYEIIVRAVEQSYFSDDIIDINYERNKTDIEKLSGVVKTFEKIGFVLGSIFVVVAILITFNTIRLTIYSHKQELEIMRLVGASNIYIRLPHVFEGLFYGVVSSLAVFVLLFITFQFVVPPLMHRIVEKVVLRSFFYEYLGPTLFFLVLAGILMGVISSVIAVRRYLKI